MTAALTRLPPAVLDKHLAFLATSDAGKTYGAKGEVEQLLDAGRRVCVIDPTGVWWGLRLQPDLKAPSPYQLPIFGGRAPKGHAPEHADVPVGDEQGARVAELIAHGDFSAIVDVSKMSVGGRTRFLADFAETLSQESRRPLHLVIDEAHLMMPQTIFSGDLNAARMVGAANHLVSGGRAQGLRIMLLTQRPAKLHNDSLTQVQTVVAMFNMAPADIAPVKKWLAINADPKTARDILASLPTLPVGQGWVYAPRLGVLERIAFGPIHTADTSAAPSDEDLARPPAQLARLDLDALRAELGAPAAPAAEGGGATGLDEATIRAAVQAAEARGHQGGVAEGRRMEQEALKASIATHPDVQRMLSLADRNARHDELRRALATVTRELERAIAAHAPVAAPAKRGAQPWPEPPAAPPEDPAPAAAAPTPQETSPPPVDVEPAGAPTLTNPQVAVLGALAWWSQLGREEPHKGEVAALAGWSPSGSNIRDRITELVASGLVERTAGGRVRLTADGREAAPKQSPGGKPIETLRAVLTNPQRIVFDGLRQLGRGGHARQDLAAELDWPADASNLRDRLTELVSLGLVERPDRGRVAIAGWAVEFPGMFPRRRT